MDKCKFCRETDQLEKHHIVPRRFDGSDDKENLVKVCPTCHSKLESLYDKSFYDELGVSKAEPKDSAGFYQIYCRICDNQSIEHFSNSSEPLKCGVCGSDKIIVESKIDEKFSELVDLDGFSKVSGKDYMIFLRYTEEHSGKQRGFIFPRGQRAPVTYGSREEAYEKAIYYLQKSWCSDASIICVEQLTDFSLAGFNDVLVSDELELTRVQDEVLNLVKDLEESDKSSGFDDLCNESSKREEVLENVVNFLKRNALVFEDENGNLVTELEEEVEK